jgi:hypothetical protein
MPGELDLNQLVKKGTVELGPDEHADERSARLRREERRDKVEHFKGVTLFVLVVAGVVVLGFFSGWIAFSDRADPESRKWAQTVLTILASGSVAFLFGRAMPRS